GQPDGRRRQTRLPGRLRAADADPDHPPRRRPTVSFRVALSLQAKALARTLLDPAQPYLALRWK
ncbi:MAG: hypothetical protein LC799_16860, partial [Actinobacteria bacterium]|nr:hypothetical protein [Actinomycetota bacterium]